MAVLSIFFITTSADSCFAKFMFRKIQQTKILCKIPQTKFKNSKLWRRKKLGFCKGSTTVASITDLPVEVDKALIEADVSLQNVDAWAKKSLESVQVIKYWFSLEKWNQNVKFRYIQVMKNKNVLNFGAMLGLSIKERWFRFKEVLVCAYCLRVLFVLYVIHSYSQSNDETNFNINSGFSLWKSGLLWNLIFIRVCNLVFFFFNSYDVALCYLFGHLARSSLTHLRGPWAVTVAALGLSFNKAISPK